MIKRIALLAVISIGLYQTWHQYGHLLNNNAPLTAEESYVNVYGRDTCAHTRKTLEQLSDAGVKHRYFVVDEEPVADRLHTVMKASGIATHRYDLPVVDVSGELMVRPQHTEILSRYQSYSL
ncbi:Uncharacterised protein [BD1-7 clade bacterium]|uniref:Glutaredoxin domain-containing protein n=1 Tax=BD1-7 clade bacterium TaxID=2029982 RepID=A0A5S9QX54_9GAMM|nr:Uncharacterised protein [BD1-7 clade bacterium]